MIKRIIHPVDTKSFFLFGPRQVGKSVFVKGLLKQNYDIYIDLLPRSNFLAYGKDLNRFTQELQYHAKKVTGKFICVVDEIQKIPLLLDEVHSLIESFNIIFILTGSSARKLKRGASNLLAGRAYTYRMFPFIFQELGDDFNLERSLKIGLLPPLWNNEKKEDPSEFLYSYTETYVKEEVQAEGLVRNILPFSKFLDIASANDGQLVNYSNLSRECGVSSVTIKQYYQILEDTFLAYRLPGWSKSIRKQLISNPRYYFFDTGVTNGLCNNYGDELDPITRGRRFEQLFFHHCIALNEYLRKRFEFFYWRTNHGAEVDFLICKGGKILCAIEVKSSDRINSADYTGLKRFKDEYPETPCFVVGINLNTRKTSNDITIIDWQKFFENIFIKL